MKKIFLFLILISLFGCSKNDNIGSLKINNDICYVDEYGDYFKYNDTSLDSSNLIKDYNELSKEIEGKKRDIFESKYQQGLLDFFNIDNKIKLMISITNEELQLLNDDYLKNDKETYRRCNLDIEFNGLVFHYQNVGIRQKGNTSRGEILNNDGRINLRHYKLSFSEVFDSNFVSYIEKRTFFGLEKLNIRWNRNADQTYIKEYYAYEFYRDSGVLAPKSNLANVVMNIDGASQNLGVYLAIEDIDKNFIKRNVIKEYDSGDLYKLGWSGDQGAKFDVLNDNLIGIESQEKLSDGTYHQKTYPYDLKTNKKTSSHKALKEFISKVIDTSTSSFASFLKTYTNYDYLITYFAVSYLLGDPDDLRGDYNNTYAYFINDSNKLIFIPTDSDRALGSTGGSNPTGHHGAYSEPFDSNTGYLNNESLFFNKSIFTSGNEAIKEDYLSKIAEILNNNFMNISTFKKHYEKVESNYSDDLVLGNMVNGNLIAFSLVENNNPFSNKNLSIEIYINTKIATFENFDSTIVNSIYYFRGEVNDWNISKYYNLELVAGIPTLIIELSNNQRFKIASSDWSIDFNYDSLVDNSMFECVNEHKDIKPKESGKYKIEIINVNGMDKLSISKIE